MHVDPENIEDIPEHMQNLLESIGWWVPDEGYPSPDIEMMYTRCHLGKCLLCEGPLGENTILILDSNGFQHGFCQPACMQDIHVMQQLMSWYDDLKHAVQFRHGGGDTVQEDDVLEEEDQEELDEILSDGGEGAEHRAGGEPGEASGEDSEEEASDPTSSREDEAEDPDTSA